MRSFLEYLAVSSRLASKTRNQAASAIVFLVREVLGEEQELDVPRAKGPAHLPSVLSHREAITVLKHLRGRQALIASLLYGAGLRIEECLNIRVKDVDFELRQIFVRDGKGNKDRYVPLAHRLIEALRAQVAWVAELHRRDRFRGDGWAPLPAALHRKDPGSGYELGWQFVFPSRRPGPDPATGRIGRWHLHPSAVQREIKHAAKQAGIVKRVGCHTFRHSFATEALRGGCDIRTLQHVLGHKDVRTTMVYLHVVEQTGFYVRSPLDRPSDPADDGWNPPMALPQLTGGSMEPSTTSDPTLDQRDDE
jgi:integron integrase